MKILVTGSAGFIGKNLVTRLKEMGDTPICFDKGNTFSELEGMIDEADAIIHLAGVNRPEQEIEFKLGNVGLLDDVLGMLEESGRKIPVLLSSSTQAEKDNPYGKSKREAEEHMFRFQEKTGIPVYVYRLQNAFGKWCRPNYNSVIATFCHNVWRDIPISVNEAAPEIEFVYIDDIVDCFISTIKSGEKYEVPHYLSVRPSYKSTPKQIADLLYSFKESRNDLFLPIQTGFAKKLYATYLSYMPMDMVGYPLRSNVDNRGSFTEMLKFKDLGQVSVNIILPGIEKGNHYHHTKNEKFIVVEGTCVTRFRHIATGEYYEIETSGEHITVVDIPTGYTHAIRNIGKEKAVVIMWANEPFDKDHPDTYYEAV